MSEADKKRNELIALLERHDWYYTLADDARYYYAGCENYQKIVSLMKEVADGEKLYGTYYNKAFPHGG